MPAALMAERARAQPAIDIVRDTIPSQMASRLDPLGGRHKVWDSRPLRVISVKSPPGCVARSFDGRPGMTYLRADGTDVVLAFEVAALAVETCRARRVPVFLHLSVVRLLGHAGTDFELEYRSLAEVEADKARDPLLATARILLDTGLLDARAILERYEALRERTERTAREVARAPRLTTVAEIVAPLAPYTPDAVRAEAEGQGDPARRVAVFGSADALPERQPPNHLAALLNLGLHDLLARYPEAVLFGEDVARKGGVYHVTTGLEKIFKPARRRKTSPVRLRLRLDWAG